jgi:hypothetical protein
MTRRIILVLVVAAMLVAIVATPAFAREEGSLELSGSVSGEVELSGLAGSGDDGHDDKQRSRAFMQIDGRVS